MVQVLSVVAVGGFLPGDGACVLLFFTHHPRIDGRNSCFFGQPFFGELHVYVRAVLISSYPGNFL